MTITETRWQLAICDDSGVSNHDFASEEEAYAGALAHVLANWESVLAGPPPENDRTAIVEYFDAVAKRGHWFSISVPMALEAVETPAVDQYTKTPNGMVKWHTLDGWTLITAEQAAARNATITERWYEQCRQVNAARADSKFPTGWPVKHRDALRAVRALMGEGGWRWSWMHKSGDGRDRPKGSFVLEHDDGRCHLFATVEHLAEHLGTAPVTAPKAASSKTTKGQLVKALQAIIDADRFMAIAPHLRDDALALLAAA